MSKENERSYVLEEAFQKREVIRDIEKGLDSREEKKKYILRLSQLETIEAYLNRVDMSVFFNVTNRMAKINYNRPYGKNAQISSENEFISSLQENFDGYGHSLTEFGRRHFKKAIYDSQAHVFFNYPKNKDNKFNPDAKPQLIVLNNDNILKAIEDDYDDLILFKFRVISDDFDIINPMKEIKKTKIYTFKKVNGIVYYNTCSDNGDEVFINEFEEPQVFDLDMIPVAQYYPEETDQPFNPYILLNDLANKNLEYFRSSSDQTHILHIARVPVMLLTGFEDKNENGVAMGVAAALMGPEGANGKFIEINGQSIEAARNYQNDLIAQMETLGLEFMNKNSTATSSIINNSQNTSLLTAYAIKQENFLKRCVKIMIKMKKKLGYKFDTEEFSLSIDTKFSIVVDQAELTFMQFLRTSGDISGETITNYAKSLGYLKSDYDYNKDYEKTLDKGI